MKLDHRNRFAACEPEPPQNRLSPGNGSSLSVGRAILTLQMVLNDHFVVHFSLKRTGVKPLALSIARRGFELMAARCPKYVQIVLREFKTREMDLCLTWDSIVER